MRVFLFALFLVFALSLTACAQTSGVTLEQFNRVQSGMTLKEVQGIFGSEGTEISTIDIGMGEHNVLVTRQWEGRTLGSSAGIVFQGGKVTSKIQLLLN